jgi:hypothetical protein
LDIPNVIVFRQGLALIVPARIERQGVLFDHPLEQPDRTGLVLEDQPILGGIAANSAKPKLRTREIIS